MTDTINGRTPEEIKKGLEHCAAEGSSCKDCVFCADCDVDIYAIERYALAYIQQLERERDAAVERCVNADDVSAGYYHEIQQHESTRPEWISVEERLPGDPLDCIGDVVELLIHKGVAEEVLPGYYDHEEKDWVIFFGDISGVYLRKHFQWWRVIKWREMPKPPKEET